MSKLVSKALVTKYFPTLEHMTYLNNAATGIPPVTMIDAVKRYLQDSVNATGDIDDTKRMFTEIKNNLSLLFGGRPENYALLPSTSDGLNSAAHSIKYPGQSNIVICDLEFPSNYVPWQNVRRIYGPELRVVRSKDGAAPLESYVELIDENTAVVSVSHVQFASGYRSNLRDLARAVHDVGGYLVADVIQSAGCVDINLAELEVDFAAAQAAKWMLGPIGAGFLYVSDRVMDDVEPRFLGWWGVEDMDDFSYKERKPLPDASKFQIGSPPMMPYVGLVPVLTLLNKIPGETRMATAMDRADYLRRRLAENGIGHYDFGDQQNSAIVSCAPHDVEKLQKKLTKLHIHCSVRSGRLRVSPHFYNAREEIDRLMEQIG